MSDAGAAPGQSPITELKVTGHLMTLDPGLFCFLQAPGAPAADTATGLPGIRITLPPGQASRNGGVAISGFRPDGWLGGREDAALIRVSNGPAQVLVTIYQAANGREPPKLQVVRLSEGARAPAAPSPAAAPPVSEIAAHVQRRGDIAAAVGEWVGDRGSQHWVEGFSIALAGIASEDLEYQAVLGRGWLSPWVEGGEYCGSRGMALPILGLRVRLRGAAAETHDCALSATFVDGTSAGPVPNGEACEAESLAPLEAFQLVLRPREAAPAAKGKAAATSKKAR